MCGRLPWAALEILLLCLLGRAMGEDLGGRVSQVNGDTAAVTLDGALLPSVGDQVEVYYKLAGLDDTCHVAGGTVTEVKDDGVSVKLDADGAKARPGNLVRISSDHPHKSGPAARAEEVAAFCEKVDLLGYAPVKHGLRDVKVVVRDSTWASDPTMSGAKVTLLWKAPDKKRVIAGGLQGADATRIAEIEQSYSWMFACLVPDTFSKGLADFTPTLSRSGEATVLNATPKPGTESAKMTTRITISFDARGLPAKMESLPSADGGPSVTVDMTYVERDGQFLIARMTSGGGRSGETMTMDSTYTYTEVEGVWLPERLTQDLMGVHTEHVFEGYEVNRGLDDALFAGAGPK